MLGSFATLRARSVTWWQSLSPLHGDAILYGAAALFSLGLGWTSHEAAQWHWGYLAFGPYALVAVLAWLAGRRPVRRETLARVALVALVMLGSVAIPLGLEARWRQAQPEVGVIERAGGALSTGQDPYHTYVKHGHVVDAVKGVPAYQSFFPYFPLMAVFGLPSAETHRSTGLTDARIIMSLMTLIVTILAIFWLRAPERRKVRVAQVMLALPTGALFLATGGDDMPILALMLLGVAALQRRSTWVAAVSIGAAAAMKLTAWPFAVGALLVTRGRSDERTWRLLASVVALIVVVTVVPFALHAPGAFLSNVFAFPLGLAGVRSPAASALPGHILTAIWSPLGHVLSPVALVIGGVVLTRYVRRHWPLSLSQLLGVLAVVFVVAICVASATRVGYVIYPLNLALWSWVCRDAPVRELQPA